MTHPEESPIIQRLKQYMAQTGLSSTQFADKAGIPRPSFSQMLNGRNKSVNNQILAKLDENFPDLDIVWLLFGRGEMRTNANFKTSEPQNNAIDQPHNQYKPEVQTANDEEIPFYGNPEAAADRRETSKTTGTPASEARWQASVLCSPPDEAPAPSRQQTISVSSDKKIVSIIVLYSDNSFETFTAS